MPDVGEALLHVLIVLVFAKLAAEVSERIGLPAVVGEIVAGVIVGPSVLGLIGHDDALRVLAELGVILLLLDVGLHMDVRELSAVGRAAMSVAVVGVVVPFAGGYGVARLLGQEGHTPLFLGAALTATSVGITARVFGDLRALATPEARTVLGAAVADDVMGLVVLTVVVRLVVDGSVSAQSVAGIMALAVGFLAVTGWAGVRFAPPLFDWVQRRARSSGTLVALALAFALGLAELATLARLAPIVGAFAAGLSLSRGRAADQIRHELTPVGHLFIPVFFLQIGIDARIGAFGRPAVLGLAGALLAVGIVGKLVAGAATGRLPMDRLLVGIGMIPRGEVGLIFAGLGLRHGVLSGDTYAALLLVVLVSTLMTPPLLRWRLEQVRRRCPTTVPSAEPMPASGWLAVSEEVVDLAATPPATAWLEVALKAAVLCGERRAGTRLLHWLDATSELVPIWGPASRRDLVRVLSDGTVRSWRFLEVTGVLDRALPELADALHKRRADPHELDPAGALRWSLVDSVRRVLNRDPLAREAGAGIPHRERVLFAALVLDCASEDRPVLVARRLAARLELGAAAEQDIAALVADVGLLRAAATRVDGLSEEHVLVLAVHLEAVGRLRMLYILTVAGGDLESWERALLDELYRLTDATLAQPGLADRESRNLVERRRAEAVRLVGDNRDAVRRIADAPRGYLLSQDAADVARHARLLDQGWTRRRVRVRVIPTSIPGQSTVEVASHDRPGLLAAVTKALTTSGLDILSAVVATWPDGTALESFRVRGPSLHDAHRLEAAIERAFDEPVGAEPVDALTLAWDEHGSPWYTLCTLSAPDRPGLLHSLAAAFAAAGVDVHAARIRTEGDLAVDVFSLTDATGGKLDAALRSTVEENLAEGVRPRPRRRFRGLHKDGTSRQQTSHRMETPAS